MATPSSAELEADGTGGLGSPSLPSSSEPAAATTPEPELEFTTEELDLVHSLKARVEASDEFSDSRILDDRQLARCLIARKWNVERAFKLSEGFGRVIRENEV